MSQCLKDTSCHFPATEKKKNSKYEPPRHWSNVWFHSRVMRPDRIPIPSPPHGVTPESVRWCSGVIQHKEIVVVLVHCIGLVTLQQ